jgi:lipoprotein-releasing system ATP-binding protein
MSNEEILSLAGIEKSFKQGFGRLDILKGVDLKVRQGEITALLGRSGSGKSTLLNIAGLLDNPDKGEVTLSGEKVTTAKDCERTLLRRDYIGFVYQSHNLLPEFTAAENVMIPMMIAEKSKKEAKERALYLLDMLGLADRATHRPAALSGGEQQRVAIARALANSPKLLLADEPTGNLDDENANVVFEMLLSVIKQTGLAALIATHNPEMAEKMDRRVTLKNGTLLQEK